MKEGGEEGTELPKLPADDNPAALEGYIKEALNNGGKGMEENSKKDGESALEIEVEELVNNSFIDAPEPKGLYSALKSIIKERFGGKKMEANDKEGNGNYDKIRKVYQTLKGLKGKLPSREKIWGSIKANKKNLAYLLIPMVMLIGFGTYLHYTNNKPEEPAVVEKVGEVEEKPKQDYQKSIEDASGALQKRLIELETGLDKLLKDYIPRYSKEIQDKYTPIINDYQKRLNRIYESITAADKEKGKLSEGDMYLAVQGYIKELDGIAVNIEGVQKDLEQSTEGFYNLEQKIKEAEQKIKERVDKVNGEVQQLPNRYPRRFQQ